MNIIKRLTTITAALTITLAIGAGGAYAGLLDNKNGTITDTGTGLVWLKNANCFDRRNWNNAMWMAATLSSGMCGLTDKSTAGQWRLPTKEELVARSADVTAFSFSDHSLFWSSSTVAGSTSNVWVVFLFTGLASQGDKMANCHVWPVRRVQ